jgi:hypothetical protein
MYLGEDYGLGDGWSRPCPPDVRTQQEERDVQLLVKLMSDRHCGLDLSSKTINCLTDVIFYRRHNELIDIDPTLTRDPIVTRLPSFKDATPAQKLLLYEWRDIKNCFVVPALKVFIRAEKKSK